MPVSSAFRVAAVIGWLWATGLAAFAQELPVDVASPQIQLGPLDLDPRLFVRNVGLDSNVFRSSADPVRDFTAVTGPELVSSARLGRFHRSSVTRLAWEFFRRSATERSIDAGHDERLAVDFTRFVPHANVSIDRSRQRPSPEIDARVARRVTTLGAGVQVKVGPHLAVDLSITEREFRFGSGAIGAEVISRSLNRRERGRTLSARYAATPLTTLTLSVARRHDRFAEATDRNSDSTFVLAGLELESRALIAGTASVGVRRLSPRDASVARFTGLVSNVNVSYTASDVTRVSLTAQRDLDYSYELAQPYYVLGAVRLTWLQAVAGTWDVSARVDRTSLDYQGVAGAGASRPRRNDTIWSVAIGPGWRLGSSVRVGFDLEHVSRASTERLRDYDGWRMGSSVTYGF